VLSLTTVLAALALAQNVAFQWANMHDSIPGMKVAAAIVPWRTEPRWWVARYADPDTGDAMMADLVKAHPWDTEIRLTAAWVAAGNGRMDLAEAYISDQLRKFPGDKIGVDSVRSGNWPP